MILRSGKYKGMDSEEVQQYDSQYMWWVKQNRPEMLKSRTPKKIEMTDEEIEQLNNYKNLPRLSCEEAFGMN